MPEPAGGALVTSSPSATGASESCSSLTANAYSRNGFRADRADKVLFINARKIFRQIDRAHRGWRLEQIEPRQHRTPLPGGDD